ncbi:MAG: hypothetical protein SWJ54_00920 [Cyanobacteriota bacterium]|nr:hypothetical protein [Cyanobacteriota bacterium]
MKNLSPSSKMQAELDLLDALFGEQPYAWNSSTSELEPDLRELDEQIALSDCLTDEDVHQKLQSLMTQVEDLWSVTTLQKSLIQKFAGSVPHDLLKALAQKAIQLKQQAGDLSNGLAEQLVQCTQEILPNWPAEDLQVLARPFAYTMRGPEIESPETPLQNTSTIPWTELSEIEQARMGLAIAHYAFLELEQQS